MPGRVGRLGKGHWLTGNCNHGEIQPVTTEQQRSARLTITEGCLWSAVLYRVKQLQEDTYKK